MKAREVTSVEIRDDELILAVDGRVYAFRLGDISARLACATAEERSRLEVSPSGYGIHWPLLDEDLSIDGLLGVVHQPHGAAEERDTRQQVGPEHAAR